MVESFCAKAYAKAGDSAVKCKKLSELEKLAA